MTRRYVDDALPPSPKKPWVKLPELRAKVESPRPNVSKLIVTPRHGDKITSVELYGRPRRSTIFSVSETSLPLTLPISQKKCPNNTVGSKVGSFRNFSMRNVALLLNGELELAVGVVEYSTKTEAVWSQLPRHTVAMYCGRSDRWEMVSRDS